MSVALVVQQLLLPVQHMKEQKLLTKDILEKEVKARWSRAVGLVLPGGEPGMENSHKWPEAGSGAP